MRLLLASLLFSAACSSAYADRPAAVHVGPRIALAVAPDKIQAPYDVQIVTESGETAPTYAHKGRYYVLGSDSDRYTIRVTNPTGQRVEAVVTVDGLDVVDGESGDLRKRGYIVPAYGHVNIEGFRTSLSDVATFRFSSVESSYAGQKGKARNVGVIAVAIFEETAPPPETQIIAPQSPRYIDPWGDDSDESASAAPRDRGGARATGSTSGRVANHHPKAEKRAAEASAAADSVRAAPAPTAGAAGAPATAPAAPRAHFDAEDGSYYEPAPPVVRKERPGLGTEFGESRYSAASYTKFVRATHRPIAIAELRYNDGPGLLALGIPVAPLPDDGEIMLRETADPFPGDQRFSRPPRR